MDDTVILRDVAQTGQDVVGDVTVDWSVVCHVGRVREANEDAALALPGRYLVADGMGGHDSGELASEAALLTLSQAPVGEDFDATRTDIAGLLVAAQEKIGAFGSDTGRRAGTTTTGVVMAAGDDGPAWVAFNIGDSRTYLYSQGSLTQVSVDHSQVQELVDAGYLTPEQARVDSRRNVITRALGAGMAEPVADYFAFAAVPGDIVVLCSDGLDGELADSEIAAVLAAADGDVEVAAAALVEAALDSGAHDNVTVAALTVSR
ncbi:PP2C family protein-serine/threonine phosphatase [Gordonia humi]|uniref:Protein phosphatase n=1 Tax=Gordonia humi TaxID=686429 RepID=A0A840EUC2_9ACTN|nr:protein phosphatase 2C domain-containing protein [Gordonia humi]MBB4136525.1 protein phosphatase [Gordonia humi]